MERPDLVRDRGRGGIAVRNLWLPPNVRKFLDQAFATKSAELESIWNMITHGDAREGK